jgi:hypothetical protein
MQCVYTGPLAFRKTLQRKLADLSLGIRRSAPNQIPLGQVNQLFPANVDEEIELYKRFEPELDGGHIQYALTVIKERCGGSQPLFSSSSTVQELIITRTGLCQGSQRMPDTGLGRMSTDVAELLILHLAIFRRK